MSSQLVSRFSQARNGGSWSTAEVATEMGGVLKARDLMTSSRSGSAQAPSSHRLFSTLTFVYGSNAVVSQTLGEADVDERGDAMNDEDELRLEDGGASRQSDSHDGGWLESDDIEDF